MIGVIKNRMATLRLPIVSEDVARPAKKQRDFTRHDTIVPDSRGKEYLHGIPHFDCSFYPHISFE
jgi:hypothetical protein